MHLRNDRHLILRKGMKSGKNWWGYRSVGVQAVGVGGLGDETWLAWQLGFLSKVEDGTQGWGEWSRFGTVNEGKRRDIHQGQGRKSAPVKFLLSSPRSSRQGVRQAGRVALLSGQEEGNGFWWTAISLCGTMTTLDFVCNLDRFSHPLTCPYSTWHSSILDFNKFLFLWRHYTLTEAERNLRNTNFPILWMRKWWITEINYFLVRQ